MSRFWTHLGAKWRDVNGGTVANCREYWCECVKLSRMRSGEKQEETLDPDSSMAYSLLVTWFSMHELPRSQGPQG